jgi:hypothetical protein
MDPTPLATIIRRKEEQRRHTYLNAEAKKHEAETAGKPLDLRLVKVRKHWQGTV